MADSIGKSLVWTTLALHGQATMDKAEAETAGKLLGLNDELIQSLQDIPLRGSSDQVPPTDPLQYRFYELVQVYGSTLKAITEGKAITFDMNVAARSVLVKDTYSSFFNRCSVAGQGNAFFDGNHYEQQRGRLADKLF